MKVLLENLCRPVLLFRKDGKKTSAGKKQTGRGGQSRNRLSPQTMVAARKNLVPATINITVA